MVWREEAKSGDHWQKILFSCRRSKIEDAESRAEISTNQMPANLNPFCVGKFLGTEYGMGRGPKPQTLNSLLRGKEKGKGKREGERRKQRRKRTIYIVSSLEPTSQSSTPS